MTGLVEDPAEVAQGEMNGPFRKWVETLAAWEERVQAVTQHPIERRRLDYQSKGAFDFLLSRTSMSNSSDRYPKRSMARLR